MAEDLLPISILNQIEYCERRFYLMHVQGEMEVNAHVLEGSLRHQNVHTAGMEQHPQQNEFRRVYVWSEALQIAGFTDLVEERPADQGEQRIIPVEYKKGRMGNWLNDHVQLCAQALCLEERLSTHIDKGYIFYFGSRRRQEVFFTPALRERTRQAVQRAQQLIRAGVLPPPNQKPARCQDCSLEPVCLPQEMRCLQDKGVK